MPRKTNLIDYLITDTICGLLVFMVVWGSLSGDFTAIDKMNAVFVLILGYLLYRFYG